MGGVRHGGGGRGYLNMLEIGLEGEEKQRGVGERSEATPSG